MEEKGKWHKKMGVKGLVIVALASLLITLGMGGDWDRFSKGRTVESWGETGSHEIRTLAESQGLPDFVSLAKKLTPAVVNISTVSLSPGGKELQNPFREEDPFNQFRKRFFGGPFPRRRQQEKSLGSGFLIDHDGSILTNNHVVANAQKVVVRLADQREFEAKVIGTDPRTDIAVIKINTRKSLPLVALGDSDHLEVGEWVLAIGNPFGLDSSVTSGIVSAKGRFIGAGPYDNFIQTDASINPGNSGGPLINLQGDVVGINTAIFSRTGGNIGIGFAIPINLAKEVLPQLQNKGKVTRGYLGVLIQKVTPDMAESFGLASPRGALVANISKDGPAAHAGVKVGDIIIEFDGRRVKESNDLPIMVAREPVGKKVPLKVLRDKHEVTLFVMVGQLQEEKIVASTRKREDLGLTVQQVTPQIAESLGLDRPEGVVITAVEPGMPADEAGMRRGDVIVEINRKPIRSLRNYRKALGVTKKGKGILFLVRRGDRTLFLALKLPR
ncbi:MAG: DegQ family serine endoprotease [Candidatus Binatia bacterium]